MSDNPTRTFKDFIGWAFVGLAGLVMALVSLIYSSVRADVGQIDATQRSHAERIKGMERDAESMRHIMERIDRNVEELMKRRFDERK